MAAAAAVGRSPSASSSAPSTPSASPSSRRRPRPKRSPRPSDPGLENGAFDLGSPDDNNNHRQESPDAPGDRNNNLPGTRRLASEPPGGRPRDAEGWRRRRTDPGTEPKHFYHRDYREALSSLLWQPYDCRDRSSENVGGEWGSWSSEREAAVGDLLRGPPPGAPASRATSVACELCCGPQCAGDSECCRLECCVPDAMSAPDTGTPAIDASTSSPAFRCGFRSPAAAPEGDAPRRTFTSTEAQTDDSGLGAERGRRRRERRERRRERPRSEQPHHHPREAPPPPPWQTQLLEAPPPPGERLPDLLNSHLPPPYSALHMGLPPPPPTAVPVAVPMPPPGAAPAPVPAPGSPPPHHHHHAHPPGMRFPFHLAPGGRRRSRGHHYTPEEEPKSCCGVVLTQTVSIRWFIVMIAFVGICCAVVGTVLGAMKASGREHLTVSLLMIGVGIVLITVSGVAWRLTAHDAPSCRMMLGMGGGDDSSLEPNRRFLPRLPPSYGRPHHPYAAMMYPEFQYRPPPPSYQASMQEYRLRLLLLDRHPGGSVVGSAQTPIGHMVSPPPTYRSHAGSTLSRAPLGLRRDPVQSDYSRPPSYRSRTSSARPTFDPNGNMGCSTTEHSRDPSLSLSESGGGSAVVNVISIMGNDRSEGQSMDSVKVLPEQEVPLRMVLNKGSHSSSMHVGSAVDEAKDANLVTIVQTGNDASPVIVTVSGSTMSTSTTVGGTSGNGIDTDMEILAHL